MFLSSFLALFLLAGICLGNDTNYDWSPVDQVLQNGIDTMVYPGCVALVAQYGEIVYSGSFGSFTYGLPAPVTGTNPPMNVDTSIFDLASLTKVTMSTTAVMQMYQNEILDLDWTVGDERLLGEAFNNNGKETITVRNLLLHDAGFPPDPVPGYYEVPFGCPQTSNYHPAEVFSCRDKVYHSVMNQTLENPVGEVYVYSDLSFITMVYVIGKLTHEYKYATINELRPECVGELKQGHGPSIYQCYYEAYINKYVLSPLDVSASFLPPSKVWGDCPPAWNDTYYRHEMLQGVVNDQNTYAMGGVSGHAGLFAVAPDIMTLMYRLAFATPYTPYVNSTTVKTFTTVYNISQSSRALGWDTNNYVVHSNPNTRQCGSLDSTTYTHTGYTGTQICSDPVNHIITILFTNRVYPDNQDRGIGPVRTNFNDAVAEILLGDKKKKN
eukprot:CAMPEP_0201488874 /NCGR_PEP_ID=MMETSP0151_2-20130828/20005_1 /ASSEMBLY_ACC=CAM_ASM_000257 /TAXON_ID=200890 /ORGANISM="Paramoeba atlantica, Strain 621/1 / CCAP 1560/9" /LENGTH=438 /DNA_ID=CAMNT_0047874265 /DNA_START=50 /DNA_END=1366 /DNA_ORIENTATION=-